MEQRIISYTKGITRSPGELIAEDGELLECINLKCEGGELKPLLWPEKAGFALNDGEELLYIHKGSGYKNYFVGVPSGSNLKVTVFSIGEDGTKKSYDFTHTFAGEKVKFESVGNTVVVLDGEGTIHYVLFKSNTYSYLGTKFPECSLSFGLQGELKRYTKNNDPFVVSFAEKIDYTQYYQNIPFSEANRRTITEQIVGRVNAFVKSEATNKGRFIYPFLVRYAYRLYDGTLTYHSAPVLMVAGSYNNPFVSVLSQTHSGDGEPFVSCRCDIASVVSQLDYQLVNSQVKESLTLWSDIIKSVDIFISAPIYTFNQDGAIEEFDKITGFDSGNNDKLEIVSEFLKSCSFVGKIVGGDTPSGKTLDELKGLYTNGNLLTSYYQRWSAVELYQIMRNEAWQGFYAVLPSYGKDLIGSRIKDCSSFYFLKSINTDALSETRELIDVDDTYLESLQSRELMSDDYQSHDILRSTHSYSYNNRLNLHGVSRELFSGFVPDSLYQYTDGASIVTFDSDNDGNISGGHFTDMSTDYCGSFKYQQVVDNGGDLVFPVKNSIKSKYDLREVGFYTYSPNVHAKYFIVGGISSYNYLSEQTFSPHKGLNGSVSLTSLNPRNPISGGVDIYDESGSPIVEDYSKIYTSEVNNPFVFPASGVNTIGTGDIIGIVSTTKALSQGQFGQFPLLVLSTDGIWAMTVNDEGLYSTKQALSRDVCNNADSIVQTDNLVFFSSERGLMAIDGANVVCVTEHMKGLPQKPNDLKRMADILKSVGGSLLDAVNVCGNEEDFISYLRGSKMGYNYRDNSLYIANGAYKYVYVYQINNRTLSKLYHDGAVASGFVNDYPDTLMQSGEDVYSLLAEPLLTGDSQHGFAMTRALKLGNPTGLKRIKQVKNMKNVLSSSSYVKYALWGSNDGLRWYYVGSYDGGFKYYRMGLFTKLAPSESVLGSVMAVEEKRNNKMR